MISTDAAASLIMVGQTLSGVAGHYPDGSYDTTHAAICIGRTEDDVPILAHFLGSSGRYEITTLDRYLAGEENRSYLIFSPKDPKKERP